MAVVTQVGADGFARTSQGGEIAGLATATARATLRGFVAAWGTPEWRDFLLVGSNEMAVDGTTPKAFVIKAAESADALYREVLHVRRITLAVAFTGADDWAKFGFLAALANGLKLAGPNGRTILLAKTSIDLARFSDGRITAQKLTADTLHAVHIDLGDDGIELLPGEAITFTVQDDLTTLDSMIASALVRRHQVGS